MACAGLAGCAGGCWAAQGEFFGLGRFLAFFPLFLLGRWTDWMALSRLLKRRWVQLLSAALLAAALVLCGLAAGPLYQMRGLFLGDGAVSGLWGGLLRAAQYAVALVLGGGILALLPRWRTPLAVRGGGALGLCLALDGPAVGPAGGDGAAAGGRRGPCAVGQSRPGA